MDYLPGEYKMATTHPTMKKRVAALAVAAAVASMMTGPRTASAQSADATLRGSAAPNTEVVVANKTTGATRRTVVQADGTYVIVGLPAGEYTVTNGSVNEDITLTVATTAQLDLTALALEKVTISGQRIVETRTSEVGSIISHREIETVPAITRNFLEFADSIPGVIFTVDGQGNNSFHGGVQQAQNINVFVDGVSMKDFVQGGLAGQSGSNKNPNQGDPGNPFPQSAIDQYKVITSNYKAEYDQLASSGITVQTKSGTNQFHGDAFFDYTDEKLRRFTPAEFAAGAKQQGKTEEWGASLGGPIIQNHMHFFAALERKELTNPNSVYPSSGSGLTASQASALLPPGVGGEFGPTKNPFGESLFFAKLDFEPLESERIEVWYTRRAEHQISGAQQQTAASAATFFLNDNDRATLRWEHFGSTWSNEFKASYQNTHSEPDSSLTTPQYIYQYIVGTGTQELIATHGGTAWAQFANSQKGTTLQDDFTFNNLQWIGDHTLKAGVKFGSIKLKYQDAGQGSEFNFAVTSAGTAATPYDAQYTLVNPGKSNVANSSDQQYGFYLQDDWTIDKHWTINAGVRWDYEKVPSWQNFVTPQPIVASLLGPYSSSITNVTYAQAMAAGGINIHDYLSTGSNRKPQSDEWQPRLGFSFDINGDQEHVLFGGYGKSYDRNIYDLMSLELTKSALAEPTINFYGSPFANGGCATAANANPGSCVAFNPVYLTSLSALQGTSTSPYGEIDLINNHIKSPYSNQFSLGIRNKLGDWNSTVTIAQINSYDRLVGWLGNRSPTGQFLVPCSWTSSGYAPAWCGPNGNAPSLIPGNNLVLWDNAARDRNRTVLLEMEKPYTRESGWTTHIAYTYTDAWQSDGYGYSGNNNYQFDFARPSQFPLTRSQSAPRHRLVVTGSMDGDWGIVWGGKLTLATPIGTTSFMGCPTLTAPGCGGNWDYPIYGEPNDKFGEKNVDLSAAKTWDLWGGSRAYVRLDVLNVFNRFEYANYNWNPSYGTTSKPKFDDNGPIFGVPRTLKITAGASF